MVFEYVLKQQGIDPKKDLTIDKSIDFGSTAAAFSGGNGDFSVEFEPGATNLEKKAPAMWLLPSVWIPAMFLTRLFLQKKAISKNTLSSSRALPTLCKKA